MRLFDLHCDTLGVATDSGVTFGANTCGVDLCRGSRYAMWTQTFAAFMPDGLSREQARSRCDCLLTTAERFSQETSDFSPVRTAEELMDPVPGCRALLALENGGVLCPDREELYALCERGVRMVGLSWNGDNPWCGGCFGSGEGLTSLGKRALATLESLSLVVDVSHLHSAGFWQVERLARRPFVATHSNAYAVTPHPRNLTDDQFRAIRDRGGLVGLNLYGEHLGGWDFTALLRHLEHFLSLGGENTLCFGTDLDGMTAPESWGGIAVMEGLWQFLAERGYAPALLDAVFYQNACRFFTAALDNFEK